MTRPIIVISRASTDWNIEKKDYKSVCSLYSPASYNGYSNIVDLWDSMFSFSFFDYKRELSNITYKQWSTLNIDGLFKNEFSLKYILDSFPDDTLILPCDDDDWISLGLIEILKTSTEDVINWGIWRTFCHKDCSIQRQKPNPFPTNGYAISVKKLKEYDNYREIFLWHLKADEILTSESELAKTYNISIKTPASIVTINHSATTIEYKEHVYSFSKILKKIDIGEFNNEIDKLIDLQEKLINSKL